jgi:hypothetical protein
MQATTVLSISRGSCSTQPSSGCRVWNKHTYYSFLFPLDKSSVVDRRYFLADSDPLNVMQSGSKTRQDADNLG